MKFAAISTWIGFGLILIGFALMIAKNHIEEGFLASMAQNYAFVFFLGMILFAWGFLQKRKVSK